jgi:protein-disulfide isomerase
VAVAHGKSPTVRSNSDEISLEDIARYARELGLDAARLIAEVESGTCAKRVQEDFRSGVRSGVNGSPTFFINGIRHEVLTIASP